MATTSGGCPWRRRLRISSAPVRWWLLGGSLDQEASDVDIAGLRDGAPLLLASGGVFRGDEAEVGHESPGRGKAPDVVDLAEDGQCCEGLDAPKATESFDLTTVLLERGEALELGVQGTVLGLEVLKVLELDGEHGLQRPLEAGA